MQLGGGTAYQAGASSHVCTPKGPSKMGKGTAAILLLAGSHISSARPGQGATSTNLSPWPLFALCMPSMAHLRVATFAVLGWRLSQCNGQL